MDPVRQRCQQRTQKTDEVWAKQFILKCHFNKKCFRLKRAEKCKIHQSNDAFKQIEILSILLTCLCFLFSNKRRSKQRQMCPIRGAEKHAVWRTRWNPPRREETISVCKRVRTGKTWPWWQESCLHVIHARVSMDQLMLTNTPTTELKKRRQKWGRALTKRKEKNNQSRHVDEDQPSVNQAAVPFPGLMH